MIGTKPILILAIFVSGACNLAHSSVVYNYTGNNYNSVFTLEPFDPVYYSTAMKVTGSFTLTESFGAFHSIDTAVIPDAFSFSDGIHTLTNDNTGLARFFFETDASGSIIDWKINLGTGYSDPVSVGDTTVSLATWSTIDSGKITKCLTPSSHIPSMCSIGIQLTEGRVLNNSGTWAVSSVPIPAAVWLFGSGLIGLIGIARRKKA